MCLFSCSKDDSNEGSSSSVEDILMQYGWQSVANYDFGTWGDSNLSLSKDQVWIYFLGNNVALGKWYYHEDDSYFGSSTSIKPLEIKYSVDGSDVTIDGTTYKYKNEALLSLDGELAFTKTSKDWDWIEKYKYYIMPDKQRLNFKFSNGYFKFGSPAKEGSKRICAIYMYLRIDGNQAPYSRQITSMHAEYYITGGKFWGKYGNVSSLKQTLSIYKDMDYDDQMKVIFETTHSDVTIKASYYIYDSKNKCDVHLSDEIYTINVDEWVNETNGGGGNDDDGDGDNDDDQNQVFKTCPDSNHPHIIDLGLPSGTLWACCNVGANKPDDYGSYYAWGETETKNDYTSSNYAYYTSDYINIGSDIASTKYDAAKANWGSSWRLPSKNQMNELISNTTHTWTSENGINGRKFTGKNGGSIFIPAAGCRWNGETEKLEERGYYWSSTLVFDSPYSAYYMVLHNTGAKTASYPPHYRKGGQSVRPIRIK